MITMSSMKHQNKKTTSSENSHVVSHGRAMFLLSTILGTFSFLEDTP